MRTRHHPLKPSCWEFRSGDAYYDFQRQHRRNVETGCRGGTEGGEVTAEECCIAPRCRVEPYWIKALPRAGLWPWKAPPGAPAPSPPRQGAIDLPGFVYVPAGTAGSRLPRASIIPVAAAASRTLRVAARSAFADPGPTGRSTGTGSYQEDGDRLGLSPGPGHVLATGFGTCEGKGRTSRPGRTGTRATCDYAGLSPG